MKIKHQKYHSSISSIIFFEQLKLSKVLEKANTKNSSNTQNITVNNKTHYLPSAIKFAMKQENNKEF